MSNVTTLPAQNSGTGAMANLTPQTLDEALRFSEILAKSSIVPKDYQGNPGNVLVAIQWGAEIGLPPLQAMQNIAVINGRPSIWGDAMIALVRGSGLLESIEEEISEDGQAATCTVQRKGETPVTRTFTMEDAKLAGLAGKQGPWKQYPKRMLQMRARAWALRDVFPDVLRGVAIAEEAQDMPVEMGDAERIDRQEQKPKSRADRARKAVAKRKAKALPPPSVDEVLQAIRQADTERALKATAELAKRLETEEQREMVRVAYRERQAELKRAEGPSADEIKAMVQSAETRDDLMAALDMAGHLGNEDKTDIQELVDERLAMMEGDE